MALKETEERHAELAKAHRESEARNHEMLQTITDHKKAVEAAQTETARARRSSVEAVQEAREAAEAEQATQAVNMKRLEESVSEQRASLRAEQRHMEETQVAALAALRLRLQQEHAKALAQVSEGMEKEHRAGLETARAVGKAEVEREINALEKRHAAALEQELERERAANKELLERETRLVEERCEALWSPGSKKGQQSEWDRRATTVVDMAETKKEGDDDNDRHHEVEGTGTHHEDLGANETEVNTDELLSAADGELEEARVWREALMSRVAADVAAEAEEEDAIHVSVDGHAVTDVCGGDLVIGSPSPPPPQLQQAQDGVKQEAVASGGELTVARVEAEATAIDALTEVSVAHTGDGRSRDEVDRSIRGGYDDAALNAALRREMAVTGSNRGGRGGIKPPRTRPPQRGADTPLHKRLMLGETTCTHLDDDEVEGWDTGEGLKGKEEDDAAAASLSFLGATSAMTPSPGSLPSSPSSFAVPITPTTASSVPEEVAEKSAVASMRALLAEMSQEAAPGATTCAGVGGVGNMGAAPERKALVGDDVVVGEEGVVEEEVVDSAVVEVGQMEEQVEEVAGMSGVGNVVVDAAKEREETNMICFAALEGKDGMMVDLINQGADVNRSIIPSTGFTALYVNNVVPGCSVVRAIDRKRYNSMYVNTLCKGPTRKYHLQAY